MLQVRPSTHIDFGVQLLDEADDPEADEETLDVMVMTSRMLTLLDGGGVMLAGAFESAGSGSGRASIRLTNCASR